MRAYRTMLVALSCAGLSLSATIVHGQSTLPTFSNPYGNAASMTDAAPAQRSTVRAAAKRRARLAHEPTPKIARKKPVSPSSPDALDLSLPATASTPPQLPHERALAPAKNKDSGFDFGVQWSAADDPHYNTETSTIPALSEIKRNANETPPETGSSIEGGVKFRF